jgi:transposase InsO family protein
MPIGCPAHNSAAGRIADSVVRRKRSEGHRSLPQPANKYPDFVRQVVQRLKALCPLMGKRRIADTLAKAGLPLAATTVKRMIDAKHPPPRGRDKRAESATDDSPEAHGRVVTARHRDHVWHVDLTVVPTCAGFWTPWFPFAVVQICPFCWWVAVAVDHFSRAVVGFAAFMRQPTSDEVRAFLSRAMGRRKVRPAHIISDHRSRNWLRALPTGIPDADPMQNLPPFLPPSVLGGRRGARPGATKGLILKGIRMVGGTGVEPVTSCM